MYSQRNLDKNKVNDYMNKTARMIINYCLANNIGTLVVGYNETFQRSSNIGKANNQNFVNIPYDKLHDKLEYICKLNSIEFLKQEESYTSKASFFDKDDILTYNADNQQSYNFSGKRIYCSLYKTANGYTFNADVNGALNILSKSKVVYLDALYCRGKVDTPIRIVFWSCQEKVETKLRVFRNLFFKLTRTNPTNSRIYPFSIIIQLNIFKNIHVGLFRIVIMCIMNKLPF